MQGEHESYFPKAEDPPRGRWLRRTLLSKVEPGRRHTLGQKLCTVSAAGQFDQGNRLPGPGSFSSCVHNTATVLLKNGGLNLKNLYLKWNKPEQIQSYLYDVFLICLDSNILSEGKKQEYVRVRVFRASTGTRGHMGIFVVNSWARKPLSVDFILGIIVGWVPVL